MEQLVLDGAGRVDVALEEEGRSIACEVSGTTSPEQELGNVEKSLAAGFDAVIVVSPDRAVLERARETVEERLAEGAEHVRVLAPEEPFAFLEDSDARAADTEATVRGWRVRTRHRPVGDEETERRMGVISKGILGATKRLRGE